jgi:hypothetical protein
MYGLRVALLLLDRRVCGFLHEVDGGEAVLFVLVAFAKK